MQIIDKQQNQLFKCECDETLVKFIPFLWYPETHNYILPQTTGCWQRAIENCCTIAIQLIETPSWTAHQSASYSECHWILWLREIVDRHLGQNSISELHSGPLSGYEIAHCRSLNMHLHTHFLIKPLVQIMKYEHCVDIFLASLKKWALHLTAILVSAHDLNPWHDISMRIYMIFLH